MHSKLIEAAKVYEDLPHQIAAFTILERYVPTVALEEFVETYAAAQKYPACPPTGCEKSYACSVANHAMAHKKGKGKGTGKKKGY